MNKRIGFCCQWFHYDQTLKKKQLEELGYDCYMIFVDTTMKTALARNAARDTRVLLDKVAVSYTHLTLPTTPYV